MNETPKTWIEFFHAHFAGVCVTICIIAFFIASACSSNGSFIR